MSSGRTGQEVIIPQEPEPPEVSTTPTRPTTVIAGDWETAVVVTDDKMHEQQASAEQDGNMFTISAGGNDIWGSADQFTFVYQEWSGDFEIVLTVHSLENTNDWAKAGPMARQNLDPGSINVIAACRGADDLVTFQRRKSPNSSSASERFTPGGALRPVTLKLTREGDIFAAAGLWTVVGHGRITLATIEFQKLLSSDSK